MTDDTIRYEVAERVATITLNRPEKLNALSPPMLRELERRLGESRYDEAVRVVHVRGAGRAFCAGYDLESHGDDQAPRSQMQDWESLDAQLRLWLSVVEFPKPVVAEVHGFCFAAGFYLAVCCDLTYVAEGTQLGGVALPLGAGILESLLPWFIGPKKTREISLVPGTRWDAEEAVQLGLATEVFPAESMQLRTREVVLRIAQVPGDLLRLKKNAANRVLFAQGFREAVLGAANVDALAHETPGAQELRQSVRELGLKETLRRLSR